VGIEIHHVALKTLQRFPTAVLFRAKEAFAFLERGEMLSLPLSRPMPLVWPGCHEIRICDKHGTFRIFYVLIVKGRIFVPHCFQKKSQKTPLGEISLAKRRIKEFLDGR
jgi:phage-related protein